MILYLSQILLIASTTIGHPRKLTHQLTLVPVLIGRVDASVDAQEVTPQVPRADTRLAVLWPAPQLVHAVVALDEGTGGRGRREVLPDVRRVVDTRRSS